MLSKSHLTRTNVTYFSANGLDNIEPCLCVCQSDGGGEASSGEKNPGSSAGQQVRSSSVLERTGVDLSLNWNWPSLCVNHMLNKRMVRSLEHVSI